MCVAFALVIGCFSLCLNINTSEAVADFSFDAATGNITGYNSSALDVVIPGDIAGYTVKGIGEGAFKGKEITSVLIPETVTQIGDEAFKSCKRLKQVAMGNGILTIGKNAFAECIAMQNITISNRLLTIGESAFSNCSALKRIDVPYSVETIGANAFSGCASLKKAVIPYSVTSIGTGVFSNCTALVSVAYQAQDAALPSSFCSGCISLSYFDIPSHITQIGTSAFEGCKSLQSISIPSSVTNIAGSAYKDCTGLKNIYIPDTVSSLGYETFAGCTGLKTAILNNSYFEEGSSGSCSDSYSGTFANCTNLTDVKILNNMTSLGAGVGRTFDGCTSLSRVTIPANVVTIPSETFNNCSPDLTIYCKPDSEALTYALAQGINTSFEPAPDFDNTAARAVIEKDIDVAVNNMYLYFDQEPIAQSGRILVPLRVIFEALGATVEWEGTTQTITAVRKGTTITLQLGSDVMYKNGTPVKLDVPAIAQNGRTLVPVRAISEAFNCDVQWRQDLYTVIITY